MVILSVQDRGGECIVTVAPVTHSPPVAANQAVEMPSIIKRRLGLDGERSWVVTAEVNRFVWPGQDLRPVSRTRPGVFAYGFVPSSLIEAIRGQIAARRGIRIVPRTA